MPGTHIQQETSRARRQSTGIAEGEYLPAYVEAVRIVNVNIEDWSIDAVGEFANKRFFDIQVMSPYFHYANGEGIYVMPEVGAYAWLCFQSTGRMASPFILGFKAPFDESNINYRCNRQNLNPGDIMLRTRDENFVILRRGGVVQLGATPTCQTIYVPIRNIIRQFCENFELDTFGGDLIWSIDRDDQAMDGMRPAKLTLRAKEKANDPKHIAELSIGSHGDADPVTLKLIIRDSGLDAGKDMVTLQITKEGNVIWDVEKDYTMNITGNFSMVGSADISLDAAGAMTLSAQKAVMVKSATDEATFDGMKQATVKSATLVSVDAPQIALGGSGAVSQGVKGTELQAWLTQLLGLLAAFSYIAPLAPAPGPQPVPVVGAPAVSALTSSMATWLSPVVTTK